MADTPSHIRIHKSKVPICPYCDHPSELTAGLEEFVIHCEKCGEAYLCRTKQDAGGRFFVTSPNEFDESETIDSPDAPRKLPSNGSSSLYKSKPDVQAQPALEAQAQPALEAQAQPALEAQSYYQAFNHEADKKSLDTSSTPSGFQGMVDDSLNAPDSRVNMTGKSKGTSRLPDVEKTLKKPDAENKYKKPSKRRSSQVASEDVVNDVVIQAPAWLVHILLLIAAVVLILGIASFVHVRWMTNDQKDGLDHFAKKLDAQIDSHIERPPTLLQEAIHAIQMGDWHVALQKLDRLEAMKETSPELIYQALLLSHEVLQNHALSSALARRIMQNEKAPILHIALAVEVKAADMRASLINKHMDQFYASLGKLNSRQRERLVSSMANIYLSREDYEQLDGTFTKLVADYDTSIAGLRNLAIARHYRWIKQNNQEEASSKGIIQGLQDAKRTHREKAAQSESVAKAFQTPDKLRQRYNPEALFKKAIKLAPNRHDLWFDLTLYYLQVDRRQEASKAIDAALKRDPFNKKYLVMSADILQGLGKRDLAIWRLSMASTLSSRDLSDQLPQRK